MPPEDIGDIRRIMIILSRNMGTGLDFLYNQPLSETILIAWEWGKIWKEAKKNGGKE